jgi:isoquinoline 1-oxidoreductase
MGQGPITSLPQMLAEELETPLDSVDIIMGDTDLCPWDMGTFGSMTTRVFGPALRAAAAEARAVLFELAAEHLQVPRDRLVVKAGAIFDSEKPERRVTYSQLTKGRKIYRWEDRRNSKGILRACAINSRSITKPTLRQSITRSKTKKESASMPKPIS